MFEPFEDGLCDAFESSGVYVTVFAVSCVFELFYEFFWVFWYQLRVSLCLARHVVTQPCLLCLQLLNRNVDFFFAYSFVHI